MPEIIQSAKRLFSGAFGYFVITSHKHQHKAQHRQTGYNHPYNQDTEFRASYSTV